MRWPGSCVRYWAQAKIQNSKEEKALEDTVQADPALAADCCIKIPKLVILIEK